MDMKNFIFDLYEATDAKCLQQFGFRIRDVTFTKIVNYLHAPKDSSSLAVTRILFGLAMLLDIPDERGGSTLDKRWDPNTCQFPLFPFLRPLSVPFMALIYAAMWVGALGLTLGYKFRVSTLVFTTCYWYLLLIEKSYWNNHSYLFGLFGLLFTFSQAHCFWSLDAHLNPATYKTTAPYWNYFVLKYQFFILYFMAGVKKGTAEWLTGYSVQNLSNHWVFEPFRLFLTAEQTDYLIVHWFVFAFDLTVSMWMMWAPTRQVAVFFCAMFNLMNSRLFTIGMFPWVCLATMPLFYPFDWPKTFIKFVREHYIFIRDVATNLMTCLKKKIMHFYTHDDCDNQGEKDPSDNAIVREYRISGDNRIFEIGEDHILNYSNRELNEENDYDDMTVEPVEEDCDTCNEQLIEESVQENTSDENAGNKTEEPKLREKFTTCVIIFYVLVQAFLPFSHSITKGYNNWTKGLYGYSWDMMVHTWDMNTVIVKVLDNDNQQEFYMDPSLYTPNDRWTRHGDMVYQYAHCLKDKLMRERRNGLKISQNISIYVDVWCSMNGRFTQRLFDPKADLLKASWSPFARVSYLMPLIDEALVWRNSLQELRKEIHSWNELSDVIFLADFPGYEQEKYIPIELTNVTLTILEGAIVYETEGTKHHLGQSYRMSTGERITLDAGLFHTVRSIGQNPAYYMYTFVNSTATVNDIVKPKLPVGKELLIRLNKIIRFTELVYRNLFKICVWCQ